MAGFVVPADEALTPNYSLMNGNFPSDQLLHFPNHTINLHQNASLGNFTLLDAILGNNSADYGGPPQYIDTRQIPYPGAYKHIYRSELIIKAVFYAIIMLIAFVGNILVVYVVWFNKRLHTTTNYYIVNLAVSDLMVTTSCTWVHLVDDLTEGWVLGAFFCKFNSFAQVLSLVSSILTLTLISCDRFFGIIFAMKAHVTERRSGVFIFLIWVCAIGISSPLLFYREQFTRVWRDHTEIWCNDTWPAVTVVDAMTGRLEISQPSRTIYYTVVSVVLYFVPVLVMTVAYTLIMVRLWVVRAPGERIESDVRNQDKMKKKIVIMLVMILVVFAVCWLPFQIAILYAEHRQNKEASLPSWFHKFHYFANYMAFANSAFNPIIYTGFNHNFRRGMKSVFGCAPKKRDYNAMKVSRDGSFRNTSQSVTIVTKI